MCRQSTTGHELLRANLRLAAIFIDKDQNKPIFRASVPLLTGTFK